MDDNAAISPEPHFHIRWSEAALDWERFDMREKAEERAKQVVRDGETYTIEAFDGACSRCRAFHTRHTAG